MKRHKPSKREIARNVVAAVRGKLDDPERGVTSDDVTYLFELLTNAVEALADECESLERTLAARTEHLT